ncbi:hypothetical protein LAZ67_7002475 [Cordylochernes scorpioides]|uniref:Uncharacterized protein n=1 Tax=Cordylochernes scorpioides TaxID=51811 RepID=A0ABY6KN70_9ARAC|nr:hypothetical protein LAZ67_7002475 [Cordylochernes scorpioides]
MYHSDLFTKQYFFSDMKKKIVFGDLFKIHISDYIYSVAYLFNISIRLYQYKWLRVCPVERAVCWATGEVERDHWQVQQSRLGLVSLTVLLGGTAGLLLVKGHLHNPPSLIAMPTSWRIRVAELAVAIWFPCALWNCACPAQLWLLNPRRLWRPLTAAPTGHGEGKALVAPPAGRNAGSVMIPSARTQGL